MQAILLIQTASPFNQAKAREALDLALALAAIEHQVSMLFQDDAVYQLLAPDFEQTTAPLKAFQKSFGLFALYDIGPCLVCQQSLAARGLAQLSLPDGFVQADSAAIQAAMQQADQLIRC
ncbi:dsrE-like protein [Alishewanella agri BL06]|uniref:DsrE-like protein n=1 Tax=Alishewanella agri BL06 TaxID=1195246 RepID=I8UEV9_9ALTE|nr:sulfurtransferase complex subunit TusC [Alishewanella agri]EIW90543.1 dsrE-like protein [Alishewanella agri BL06]